MGLLEGRIIERVFPNSDSLSTVLGKLSTEERILEGKKGSNWLIYSG
jgi:hypothetical protein